MGENRARRRLAAIVAADVSGYSRLVGEDEEGTVARLKALTRERIDPLVAEHAGRIVKTAGDGILMEFASAVDAIRCMLDLQRAVTAAEAIHPADRRLSFRIGAHVGDIIVDDDDIHGDGVNVAARLEALAEPGGICVSATAWDQVRDRIPIQAESLGEKQLKNIARPIEVWRIVVDAPAERPALPLPDKPSIAVLPFQNMSGDPEQDYFADGLVEEVVTALSRFHWLFVIARNSSFTYKGMAVDVKRVSRELGVRYVLEGSVRRSGNKVRITGQLIDGTTGAHLWADRFDGTLGDIFDLQDQVTMSVVGAIEPKLTRVEIERARRKPAGSLNAYDLYLRGLFLFYQFTAESMAASLDLFDQAMAADPALAAAPAMAAYCRQRLVVHGVRAQSPEDEKQTIALAERALAIGKDDATALIYAGSIFGNIGRDQDLAMACVERGLRLNPNAFVGWQNRGWLDLFRGDTEPAISALTHALRLSPFDPLAHSARGGLGVAFFFLRRFEDAIAHLRSAMDENPSYAPAHWFLAAAYAHLERDDEARRMVARLIERQPASRSLRDLAGKLPFKNPIQLELLLGGLRKAGLPEAS